MKHEIDMFYWNGREYVQMTEEQARIRHKGKLVRELENMRLVSAPGDEIAWRRIRKLERMIKFYEKK